MRVSVTEAERVHSRKKLMYKDYQYGKRIWELEQAWNEAQRDGNTYYMQLYDRRIEQMYKDAGMSEK